jgi:bacterial/archaeal transporter family protein
MWVWFSVCSAVLLGFYDVAKKQALKSNGVLWILLCATGLSALFLCPFLSAGSLTDHLSLVLKAVLVSSSWVSGLIALKLLPLTTASTIKASRPMFVVIFSIILFGERLSLLQWAGVALIMAALLLLARSSRKEGINFTSDKGIAWMVVSVLTGAASALYDKHILAHLQPMFVQSWSNVYITALLALLILIKYLRDKGSVEKFRWDWMLLLIAVLITISDALYFYAVKEEGALLSVISMIRRSSVLITFIFGALVFKEHHIRDKAIDLAILLGGLALLLFASA